MFVIFAKALLMCCSSLGQLLTKTMPSILSNLISTTGMHCKFNKYYSQVCMQETIALYIQCGGYSICILHKLKHSNSIVVCVQDTTGKPSLCRMQLKCRHLFDCYMLKHCATMVTTKQSKQLDCFYSVDNTVAHMQSNE